MSDLIDRFFGRGVPAPGGPPVANPDLAAPPGLQVLFPDPLDLDADGLTLALRAVHAETAAGTVELVAVPPGPTPDGSPSPVLLGLAGWDRHVVKVVGFAAPMPAAAVEACVRPAHFADEIKQAAYGHPAHVLLYYAGYEADPFERYVAVAVVAGVLARFGAVVVANETARTAVPALALLPHEEDGGDTLAALRALPIPVLYGGFVKVEVEGDPGVWMRTFGNGLLELPDLAYRAVGHDQGEEVFDLFAGLLAYLRESKAAFAAGDTLTVGPGRVLAVRDRTPAEWFLESPGTMLVLEPAVV